MIEETRILMGILLPNWFTFNHYTSNSLSDYQWKDGKMIIAYAICTRIMASEFGKSERSHEQGSFHSGYYFRTRCKGCYRRHYDASHRHESKERQAIHRPLRALRRSKTLDSLHVQILIMICFVIRRFSAKKLVKNSKFLFC